MTKNKTSEKTEENAPSYRSDYIKRTYEEVRIMLEKESPELVEEYRDIVESSKRFSTLDENGQEQYLYGIEHVLTERGPAAAKEYNQILEDKSVKNWMFLYAANKLFVKDAEAGNAYIDAINNELILYKIDKWGEGSLLLEISRLFGENVDAGNAFVKGYSKLKRVVPTEWSKLWNRAALNEFVFGAPAAYRKSIEDGDAYIEEERKRFVGFLKSQRKIPFLRRANLPGGLMDLDEAIKRGIFTEEEFQTFDWEAPKQ